jgi:hypothetical protein
LVHHQTVRIAAERSPTRGRDCPPRQKNVLADEVFTIGNAPSLDSQTVSPSTVRQHCAARVREAISNVLVRLISCG